MPSENWTPGPWSAARMTVHGSLPNREQLIEYITRTVDAGLAEGRTDFYFVWCTKEDGDADVCHTGNGPTSLANAHLIAAAPEMYSILKRVLSYADLIEYDRERVEAVLAKARGEVKP